MIPGTLSQMEGTVMCHPKGCFFWIFKIPLTVVKIAKSNFSPSKGCKNSDFIPFKDLFGTSKGT